MLPAERFDEFQKIPSAPDQEIYGPLAALYNWLNALNKTARDRSANEERAIGGVLTQNSTHLDAEDRKNLEGAIKQIADIQQALRD